MISARLAHVGIGVEPLDLGKVIGGFAGLAALQLEFAALEYLLRRVIVRSMLSRRSTRAAAARQHCRDQQSAGNQPRKGHACHAVLTPKTIPAGHPRPRGDLAQKIPVQNAFAAIRRLPPERSGDGGAFVVAQARARQAGGGAGRQSTRRHACGSARTGRAAARWSARDPRAPLYSAPGSAPRPARGRQAHPASCGAPARRHGAARRG